jgi:predicted SAM-dependent methyltransferase
VINEAMKIKGEFQEKADNEWIVIKDPSRPSYSMLCRQCTRSAFNGRKISFN